MLTLTINNQTKDGKKSLNLKINMKNQTQGKLRTLRNLPKSIKHLYLEQEVQNNQNVRNN